MFISALILFFLVLITYSFIESFNTPVIEGLQNKDNKPAPAQPPATKAEKKEEIKAKLTGVKAEPKVEPKAVSAPPPAPTIDVTPRLNDFDARIKELTTRVTNVETQVQTIQTGLAGSQQTSVDVGEEDAEDV